MDQIVGRVARAAKILVACSAIVGPVAGAQITWTNWTAFTTGNTTGTATGTMGGVGVTYTGEVQAGSQKTAGGGTQYYNPTNSDGSSHQFTSATYGTNGPGTNPGFVQLFGGQNVTNTLTFSTPVNDVYFAIISMGQQTIPVTYTFTSGQTFTINSQGAGWWGTCGSPPCLTQSGQAITGTEADGTLLFTAPPGGSISSISFTASPYENWHGITVGTTTTPEPSSMALLGTGLIGLVPMVRRRRK